MNRKNNTKLEIIREKLSGYVSKRDAEGAASMYTEDACFMPHQSPVHRGRAKIIEAYNSDFKKGVTGLTLSPCEVLEMEGYVAERGDATVTINIGEGRHIDRVVKYVVLWKNTPDGYKMHWDILNPNNP